MRKNSNCDAQKKCYPLLGPKTAAVASFPEHLSVTIVPFFNELVFKNLRNNTERKLCHFDRENLN